MRPTMGIVKMVGEAFQKLDMMDKYQKLNNKYPPPKWEYRYIKGKRVKIRRQDLHSSKGSSTWVKKPDKETHPASYESIENAENSHDLLDEVEDYQLHSTDVSVDTIDSSSSVS